MIIIPQTLFTIFNKIDLIFYTNKTNNPISLTNKITNIVGNRITLNAALQIFILEVEILIGVVVVVFMEIENKEIIIVEVEALVVVLGTVPLDIITPVMIMIVVILTHIAILTKEKVTIKIAILTSLEES
jgi:hypothetical protein